MSLHDIYTSFVYLCSFDTMLLPPDPMVSENDTKNDNYPKKAEEEEKPLGFGRSLRGA